MSLAVERFMSPVPHTIGRDQSLAAAHRLMRQHDLRHLPVLQGGALVGVVSQRDLYLVESLTDVDLERVPVSEAMTTEVEAVDPRTPLREVVTIMAEKKIGSVIVAQGKRIIGIFTVTDALRTLALLLGEPQASAQVRVLRPVAP